MFDSSNLPYSPLPGTTPAPRALFVDRWGTLLETPSRGWVAGPDEVRFVPGALNALFRAVRAHWRIYLVGNEDSVAYGRISRDDWQAIQDHILGELQAAGVLLSRDYTCLSRPDGVQGQVADSVYLLPNTGAFYHAAHTDGVELRKSWVIGDETLELVAGWRSGCRMAGVRTGEALADREYVVEPEIVADDLAAVVAVLLQQAAIGA